VSPRSSGTPRLSVITPLFNCLGRTQAMLSSLRASVPAGVSYEVILVDDGSTDGTREWLAGLREPYRVVLNERNLGFGAATNRGAAVARGRILALLNNDLVLRRGWLPPMLWALRLLGRRAGLVGNVQIDASSGEVDHAGIFVNEKGYPTRCQSSCARGAGRSP
jgi:O-antigen biosynthesis protein